MLYKDRVKACIRQHLPKCCVKFAGDIAVNVVAVDRGLKPSFLFDYAFVSTNVMANFVENLYQESLILNLLDVVSISDHILVTRFSSLIDHLHDTCEGYERKNVLIDVSKHLKDPEIMGDSDCERVITSCLDSIKCAEVNSEKQCRIVKLSEEHNATTLFGLLLGYPVIYWYSSENTDTGNCLDMVPIRVIKVFSVLDEGESHKHNSSIKTKLNHSVNERQLHSIYSWSYPNEFKTQCQKYVDGWQQNLHSIASKQISANSLLFKDEVVSLPVVVM